MIKYLFQCCKEEVECKDRVKAGVDPKAELSGQADTE